MAKHSEIKEKIIIATLKIIRTQGMRFIRHRAVAEEAGVSLGSTTYHFKNIEDLVLSAFEYWYEMEDVGNNPYFVAIETDIQSIDNVSSTVLVDKLVETCEHYIRNQVVDRRADREIELAFHNEAIRNKRLSSLLVHSWQCEINRIESLYRIIDSKTPVQDAEITFSLILHVEKKLMMLETAESFEQEFSKLSEVLRRHIHLVVRAAGTA
ncbi:hypothetical protein SOPP22_12765 [Shewanella sp. OPT22]|nr:hypothetical protein SOPP22_12765 [Shewanella sp. OPT22]